MDDIEVYNSNTTLVKVKYGNNPRFSQVMQNSNTTLVKVKLCLMLEKKQV